MAQKSPELYFRKLGKVLARLSCFALSKILANTFQFVTFQKRIFGRIGSMPEPQITIKSRPPGHAASVLVHSYHPVIVSKPIMTSLHTSSTPVTRNTWRQYTTPFTKRQTPSNGRSNQAVSRMTNERHRFTSPVTWSKFLSINWSTRITTIH